MTDRELMQMALDALESWQKTCLDCGRGSEELSRATQPIKALRERLAQWDALDKMVAENERLGLYDSPPKREWVGLTDEEIHAEICKEYAYEYSRVFLVCQAIEAKLKEKNT